MATPRIADCGEKFLPQSFNPEISIRFADVIANMLNHTGAALTYILRFYILLPAAVALVLVELLVRLDNAVAGKSEKLAEVLR